MCVCVCVCVNSGDDNIYIYILYYIIKKICTNCLGPHDEPKELVCVEGIRINHTYKLLCAIFQRRWVCDFPFSWCNGQNTKHQWQKHENHWHVTCWGVILSTFSGSFTLIQAAKSFTSINSCDAAGSPAALFFIFSFFFLAFEQISFKFSTPSPIKSSPLISSTWQLIRLQSLYRDYSTIRS